jgi:hypothetical protein
MATVQRLATKNKVVKFRRDLRYYCKSSLRIIDKQQRLQPLSFNFAQNYVQEKLQQQMKETGRIRAIVLKARQEGISTYVAARFYRRATLYKNQNCVVIADLKKRGAVLFNIYETYYRYMPDGYRPAKRYSSKQAQLVFDTIDGRGGLNSKITVETARDTSSGRGSTISCLHASEVAFWENAGDLWHGLVNAIPDQGSEIVIESTANGVGNFFHQMWQDAEAGLSGYLAIFLPWWIHEEYQAELPAGMHDHMLATLSDWERKAYTVGLEWDGGVHRLTLEQLLWRRNKIRGDFRGDERLFRQEYPSNPREAFLVSGNLFFNEESLLRYEESAYPPLMRADMIRRGDTITPMRTAQGDLRIFRLPDPKGHYVIFADTATGKLASERETVSLADPEKGGRDFSAAWVYDTRSHTYAAILHGRMPPEVLAEQLALLGYYYTNASTRDDELRRPALIGVERNHSSGETVLNLLKDTWAYPTLYYHRLVNRRNGDKHTTTLGFVTTVDNRQMMLDEFAQALRENDVHLPDSDTIRECFTFIRDDTGKPQAAEECHDDRVMAAAGAYFISRFSRPLKPRVRKPGQSRQKVPVGNSPTGLFTY